MRCPLCSFDSTRVVDSRLSEPGDAVRRRRECAGCGGRFTTYERSEAVSLGVRKRDGRREAYDRQKLLGGLLRAATKRPVSVPELEAIADGIESEMRREGGEADSERIGGLALRALAGLDRVAAIRFASVYRNFDGPDDFLAELGSLSETADPSDPESIIGRSVASPREGTSDQSNVVRRSHAE